MKRFVAIVFLLTSFYAQAQTTEQTVLNLSKKKFGWMVRQRFDSLQAVLDEQLVFVHSNGWTEKGTEFVDDIKSGKLKYVSIEVQESSARIYQTTAIIMGKGKFTVVLEGNRWISICITPKFTFRKKESGCWPRGMRTECRERL